MHIKITERDGGWNLWATEKGTDAEAAIYTARGRTRDQIINLLRSIVDDSPAPITTAVVTEPTGSSALFTRTAQGSALHAMLDTLNGWSKDTRSNHEALGHRGEDRGSECWISFTITDIRDMINETARALGIPTLYANREDQS